MMNPMDNTKTSIKQEIIKFLESNGPKSKSKIEDYIRAEMGNNGDTISRRIREMVVGGVLRKDLREFEGKKYWEYSMTKYDKLPNYEWNHPVENERLVGIVTSASTEQSELNLK